MKWEDIQGIPHAKVGETTLRISDYIEEIKVLTSTHDKRFYTLELLTQEGWKTLRKVQYVVVPGRDIVMQSASIRSLKEYASYLYE